ncbi:hypothetical protein ACN47E_008622 [Coniothyrium glycines]
MADTEASKSGWSDRELLSSLLSIIDRDNITLTYKNGLYPAGRNASGFSQKLARFKNSLKPEWEALAAGQPLSETPAKTKATPRKRKTKGEDEANADADGSPKKKGRGRPKKSSEKVDESEESTVKAESKEDDAEDMEDEI